MVIHPYSSGVQNEFQKDFSFYKSLQQKSFTWFSFLCFSPAYVTDSSDYPGHLFASRLKTKSEHCVVRRSLKRSVIRYSKIPPFNFLLKGR